MKSKTWSISSIQGIIDKMKRKKTAASKDAKPKQQSNAFTSAGLRRSSRDKVDLVVIRGVHLPVSRRCTCVTTGDIRGD